ncbi:Tre-2/Bub2/Cdc16 (TBC) domain-containing protein C [Monocercomonoides exilis]|uniref:Tre-2/Bub2/Cdc16 (TBC) domain-containing protein C n=1 Tax=Monocercomonoides exilis TaxID=2049356 RepID=UPI003559BD1B|nr:Tre-2/Bub2/Cdc16 (TBC) domain-containing protein C [Monocercomonoides exilis]|eukprot:MONOS_5387.1-p1 / transcript=MONOS_5387.1 / gene=MONOS_5387 / organism=Monocercomonoides_exilis_PA203 / gene_product=Tre-2/Bub2/Cdc16 (TBC) domain-containing protein C / transcript_product=Tre-2/Bub2/Cdc16 (TBC) domain-containing protein C / location=Mono_scaffold00156:5512-7213(-) / protein_length=361 / sequence_SO=supercontig / SO=protein_coding / is_pseudo=false
MTRVDYEKLLDPSNSFTCDEILGKLRSLILSEGLPDSEGIENDREDGIRGRVWKILLRIPRIDSGLYLELVARKKCQLGDKIRDDTFRTLGKDDKFKQGVAEVKLVRVLNATEHYLREIQSDISYVQGMSFMLAPFLYVMPEVDAFFCFRRFIISYCPNYVYGMLDGVHAGLALMEEIFEICEPELHHYILRGQLTTSVYAFSSLMSFLVDALPVQELMIVWDFLLSHGVHLIVVCVCARYILLKEKIFEVTKAGMSKMTYMPELRQLKARDIIHKTMEMIKLIPDELFDRLVKHPWHPSFLKKNQKLLPPPTMTLSKMMMLAQQDKLKSAQDKSDPKDAANAVKEEEDDDEDEDMDWGD